jgi:uncharacterized protein Smg (DUF494 family)
MIHARAEVAKNIKIVAEENKKCHLPFLLTGFVKGNRMKKDIKKLLDSFLSEVHKNSDQEDPIDKLERMGFSEKEIDEAIEAVAQRANPFFVIRKFSRVLGESEKLSLSTEAQGYLIKLIDSGLISESELGILLEAISIESSYPASVKDIKFFIKRFVGDLYDNFSNSSVKSNLRIN